MMTAERGKRINSVDGLNDALSARNLGEAKKHLATTWGEIRARLPEDFDPHHVAFLRDYFRAQLRVQQGRRTKAQRIFGGLDKKTGYKEFEQEKQEWLAAVDLAVRGENRREIEPAFKI